MIPRVCWDTNPLVSAMLQRLGIPRQLLDFARNEEIEVVVSSGTLAELSDVLRRPHIVSRYGITDVDAEEFIQGLRDFALVAPGELSLDVVVSDPKDNHVLAAAVETQCDFLVTGDKHLLTLALFGSLRIVKPRDLLDNLHNLEP